VNIAVIGTGNVGGALGARWAQAGHQVWFGSRDAKAEKVTELLSKAGENAQAVTIPEAVAAADVVLLATPWPAAQATIALAGDLTGKILVDCINPINANFTGLDLGYTESGSEKIAEWAPTARVVKAFNTVSAATMGDAAYGDTTATLLFCGDDEDAKQTIDTLATELGFDAVDAGELAMARYLEPLAMLYIKLAISHKWGGNCAIKILQR